MKRYSKPTLPPFSRTSALALGLVCALSGACSGTSRSGPATSATADRPGDGTGSSPAGPATPSNPGTPATAAAAGSAPAAAPTPVTRPGKRLTIPEARRYMVQLVNRDRAKMGLAPVELDEGPPTIAGQAHADDMARLGYLGHWGSDGSVPEQRHTDAGGADMVLENALGFTDEIKRTLDPKPLIDPVQIERSESLYFDEVPPNDGHRKNILKPGHTRVGIGIAQPMATPTEIAVPCFVQEFTDNYGTYTPLPKKAKVGTIVHVEATMIAGARPTGVGVARASKPAPIPPSELNKRRSYPVPKPFQMYWGPGFVSPIPVKIEGQKLSIDVPLDDKGQPGLYEISVWAKLGGSQEQTMVGLRTILVD